MTGGVLPDCVERQGGGVECDAVEDDRGAQAVPSPQCSGKDGGGEREKRHDHQQEGVEQEYDSVGKPDLIKHNVVVCPYLPDEQKAQGVGQVGRPQCAQATQQVRVVGRRPDAQDQQGDRDGEDGVTEKDQSPRGPMH